MAEILVREPSTRSLGGTVETLFPRFIQYADCSPATARGYLTCLRQFARWVSVAEYHHPTRDTVIAYKEYLNGAHFGRTGKEYLTPGTKQQYIRAVKHFFRWTESEGIFPDIAKSVHNIRLDRGTRRRDALPRESVSKIADSISRDTEAGKRLYAMYMISVTCGTRTVELSRANVEDLRQISGKTYLFLQGKGRLEKDQPVLLTQEVLLALNEYLSTRTDALAGKSPLFSSTSNRNRGGRIAPTTISTMLKGALKGAGYDSSRWTAHSLRHTSGTGAYKATGNLFLAQKHQRHADPATTEIYIHAAERESRTTEQSVYNFYFKPDSSTGIRNETAELLKNVPPEKIAYLRDFLMAIQ